MIVNNIEAGWEVIFQPAHGMLAGHIAQCLNEQHRTPLWTFTQTAITMHDDESEDFLDHADDYLTELGAPKQLKFKNGSELVELLDDCTPDLRQWMFTV